MKYLVYVGVFIFIYILSTLDFDILLNKITTIEPLYLIIAFLLNIPMIYFKSFRWQKILNKQNITLNPNKSFEYYMSSLYLGFITPGRVGEFSRVLYIKGLNKEKEYGSIFSSVILDRLFDLYFLIILTVIGFSYMSLDIDIMYIISFLVLFFLIPFILLKTNIVLNIFYKLASKFSNSFKEKSTLFIDSFVSSSKQVLSKKNLLIFILFTTLSYLIFFTQAYLITMSLNMNINFFLIMFIMAISNTISLLPISISGVGTRDMILIYFLVPLGFTNEYAVLYSTFVLLVFFVGCSLIGFFYFLRNPINLNLLKAKSD